MPRTCKRLTAQLIEAITKRIKKGAYPYVAAESLGIPRSTFYEWMAKGEGGRQPYRELSDKVRTAAATARYDAETRVHKERPFEWLRQGPGRERPGEPGWTDTAQTLRIEGGASPVQVEFCDAHSLAEEQREHEARMMEAVRVLRDLGYANERFLLPSYAGDEDDDEAELIDVTP